MRRRERRRGKGRSKGRKREREGDEEKGEEKGRRRGGVSGDTCKGKRGGNLIVIVCMCKQTLSTFFITIDFEPYTIDCSKSTCSEREREGGGRGGERGRGGEGGGRGR